MRSFTVRDLEELAKLEPMLTSLDEPTLIDLLVDPAAKVAFP